MAADFVSKAALKRIKAAGVSQYQVGITIDGPPITGSNDENWPVLSNDTIVGKITSAVHSPRLGKNIALALVAADHAATGTMVSIDMAGDLRQAEIVPKPFFDPKKTLAAKG